MKLLVLGGTIFLGRHLVAAALARGHEVTLFNRGKQLVPEFAALEHLVGDRNAGQLQALAGRTWDAVIDTNTLQPDTARATAAALAATTGHYTYISSLAVYENLSIVGITESDTLRSPQLTNLDAVDSGQRYGELKAGCEWLFGEVWGDRTPQGLGDRLLVVRPGFLAGPFDPTDRLTYWARRLAQGGPVLAPGQPERPVQWLDARDLAAWVVGAIEAGRSGAYNTSSPEKALTFGETLGAIAQVTAAAGCPPAELVWVEEEFLAATGVQPWVELPLWIPAQEVAYRAMLRLDTRKAAAAGLVCRPLAETLGDLLAWDRSRGETPLRAGLAGDREAKLLADWQSFQAM